jgi:hypothetical protein
MYSWDHKKAFRSISEGFFIERGRSNWFAVKRRALGRAGFL